MDQVITELLKYGTLGPVLVALGWYTWELRKELKETHAKLDAAHESRTTDAQAVTAQMLDLSDKWSEQIHEVIQLVREIKSLIREMRERMR